MTQPVKLNDAGEIVKRQSSVWLPPKTFEQAEQLRDLWQLPKTRFFSRVVEEAVEAAWKAAFGETATEKGG